MTTALTIAGYIVADAEGIIHGYGETADAAEADMRRTLDMARIDILPDDADEPTDYASWIYASSLKTWPATVALLSDASFHGGDTDWRQRGGIACTKDEGEDAELNRICDERIGQPVVKVSREEL